MGFSTGKAWVQVSNLSLFLLFLFLFLWCVAYPLKFSLSPPTVSGMRAAPDLQCPWGSRKETVRTYNTGFVERVVSQTWWFLYMWRDPTRVFLLAPLCPSLDRKSNWIWSWSLKVFSCPPISSFLSLGGWPILQNCMLCSGLAICFQHNGNVCHGGNIFHISLQGKPMVLQHDLWLNRQVWLILERRILELARPQI